MMDDSLSDKNSNIISMRFEYLKMRFKDTSTSTKAQSRLVYFVDIGVLLFLYFGIKTFGVSRIVILIFCLPVFILSLINFVHAEFIYVQRSWLHAIDDEFCKLLEIGKISFKKSKAHFISAHDTYRIIHTLIGVTLLIALVVMFTYGMSII